MKPGRVANKAALEIRLPRAREVAFILVILARRACTSNADQQYPHRVATHDSATGLIPGRRCRRQRRGLPARREVSAHFLADAAKAGYSSRHVRRNPHLV
jgi:hypothetical protein